MLRRSIYLLAALAVPLAADATAAPVLPHVYHSGVALGPYGGTVSRAVTYWKGVVYVSVDAQTCYTGQLASSETLFAVDVRDPDHLRYLSKGAQGGCKANGLVVLEDRLYVAHWFGMLTIWDVNTPEEFRFLGQYVPEDRAAWDVSVSNQRAYVAEARELNSSFHIVDVSNPVNPVAVKVVDEEGGPAVRGSYSYYTDGTLFKVQNISDELNPYTMSAVDLQQVVGEIALRDRYAFVKLGYPPDENTGLVVFDISDPLNPLEVGRWTVGGATAFRGVFLLGDLAFLPTSGNGFFTVDISDPTQPRTLAQTEVPYYALELGVTGNGRFVYVGTCAEEHQDSGGVHAFEVLTQDPDNAGPGRWSNFSLGEASWDVQYDCDALPTAASPAWTLMEGSETWASIEDGALRINDTGTSPGDKVKWTLNWDATNTRGTTVLVRAKCPSYQMAPDPSTMGNIFIRDGTYAEQFVILTDRIRAVHANVEYSLQNGAGADWHVYRFTTKGPEFKVYLDENPVEVLSGPLLVTRSQDPDAARARLLIGSGSSAGTQDISVDYVYAFSNGAVPPPPAIIDWTPSFSVNVADSPGKGSLSGIKQDSARVSWSTDGGSTWQSSGGSQWQVFYEADALPSAATPAWVLSDGSEAWATMADGILQISDTSTAPGSKVRWSRDWNSSPAIGTTVLLRARCTAAGGDTTYLANLLIEDGVHHEQFQILPDRLVAVESGMSAPVDGAQWHVYRITTRDGQFRVYVDEAPTPLLTGTLTQPSTANRIDFGSTASAGTQQLSLDYLRYTTEGELGPDQGGGGGPVLVTFSAANPTIPADRGVITASDIPFDANSDVLNKVRFSIQDLAGNTGLSPAYTVRIQKPLRSADFDHDGDVDQEDFGHIQACFSGDGDSCSEACRDADLDEDGDVDGRDFSERFVPCMNGPNRPPGC